MNRQVVGPITCCLWFACGLLAAPRKADAPLAYYVQSVVGDKSVYELDDGGRRWEETHEVTEVRLCGAAVLVTLRAASESKTASWQMQASDKGVYEVRDGDDEAGRCFWRLRLPFKKGETWETSHTQDGESYVMKHTSSEEEELEVPAGRFRCVRVETESVFKGVTVTLTAWVAPKHGPLKYSLVAKDGVRMDYVRTMVLKSFTAGKK